jgi:hypothetical protein
MTNQKVYRKEPPKKSKKSPAADRTTIHGYACQDFRSTQMCTPRQNIEQKGRADDKSHVARMFCVPRSFSYPESDRQWVGFPGAANPKTSRNPQGRTARNAGKPETRISIVSTEPMSSSLVTKATHAPRKSDFTRTTAPKVGCVSPPLPFVLKLSDILISRSHISTSEESSLMHRRTGSLRCRPRTTAPGNELVCPQLLKSIH